VRNETRRESTDLAQRLISNARSRRILGESFHAEEIAFIARSCYVELGYPFLEPAGGELAV